MQKKKRILLKIGSNTLTKETDNISRGKIEDLASQISQLQDTCEFIIVSSGAIAVAKQFVKLESKQKEVFVKQALASIGQPHLIRIYQEIFREYGLLSSQCLLSYSDFEKEESRTNITNTIKVLVNNSYIPIINENDTVATDEIKFGDYIGVTPIIITPDMVGKVVGVFTNIDIKPKGALDATLRKAKKPKTREAAQLKAIELVRGYGGFAGFCTSGEDLNNLLKEFFKGISK